MDDDLLAAHLLSRVRVADRASTKLIAAVIGIDNLARFDGFGIIGDCENYRLHNRAHLVCVFARGKI